ncbi:Alpha/Beta hydrolase protein [Umbelopsis sp. PMI_123]|nr:Alpha/Beta hydrolase protein [Umbelopsis sp. PMI_123]
MHLPSNQLSTLATALLLFSNGALVKAALYDNVIETKYGPVQGYRAFTSEPKWQPNKLEKHRRQLPGGDNHWKAPQPLTSWNTTLNASTFGNVCPSATSGTNYTINEDCLNLNIWSGGYYPAGSTAADPLLDGGGMADKEIVFVNYNYRTGSFGWLAHSELSEEFEKVSGSNSSGNWGMLDQFAALKWIYENIEAFGGDPEHITVMGQSAGSAATGVRDPQDPLCSSLAESYLTLDDALDQGKSYLSSLNVTTIAEARQLAMDDLVTGLDVFGSTGWSFTATLDYYAMPDTYYNTLVKGLGSDVPVMTGNTKDESGATYCLNITLEQYMKDLNATFGSDWDKKFFDVCSANDSASASAAYNAQFTDHSNVDQGAYHESEINYVLNNLYATDLAWTTDDYAIAAKMNAYWAHFIKTGNPNGDGLTEWYSANLTETVQHVGNGWGAVPIAPSSAVKLFKSWFATLPKF